MIDADTLRATIKELTVKREQAEASARQAMAAAQAAQGGIETCEYLLSTLDKVSRGDDALLVGPGTEIAPGLTVVGDPEPIAA